MANSSASAKDNNSTNETHVIVEIQGAERNAEFDENPPRRRILRRVQRQLRKNKNHIYDPMVLSLGPYHHNKSPNSEFYPVEEFKSEVLNIMLDRTAQGVFRSKILERVDEIRIFYGGVSMDEYKDEELAEMMLRDTCFLLYFMEMWMGDTEKNKKFMHRLGLSVALFLDRDMFMLENQIPLWVLKLMIRLKFGKDEEEAFLCKFLSVAILSDDGLTRLPWEDEDLEPLHPLEALSRIFCKREIFNTIEVHHRNVFEFSWRQRKSSSSQIKKLEEANSPFRSVTHLKIKGIHFGPSSRCLTDIRFNSYWFYGKLQLPIAHINNNSLVYFSNLIAFEMSPETHTDLSVLSYVNFMKSLLETPKDVKELREKGVLFSNLRNDDDVVKIFKEIDTYGVDNIYTFQEVKMRINEHCRSKGKTWMAELIHTKFHTPWTVIALLAAIFLLCLTFLQTYYTINPR